jgi:hypothetical protein
MCACVHETETFDSVPERWPMAPCELVKDVEPMPPVLSYRLAYLRRWLSGIRTYASSATSCQAGRLNPGGALDHGALATFAADIGPVAAHGAPVTGDADIGDAVPDHGTLVDGCEDSMLFVLDGFEGFG